MRAEAVIRDAKFREDLRTGADGIYQRLDLINGRVSRNDTRLSAIEHRQAFEDGRQKALDARIQPTSGGKRKPGDEEIRISVTPKMWAAGATVMGIIYSVIYVVLRRWMDGHGE